MIKKPEGWDHLIWWESGERQAVEERIEDKISHGYTINPTTSNLYRALELVPFESCKVIIVGQDPYPEPKYATGVAFSIPVGTRTFPRTLGNIFVEYSSDLGLETPPTGNLEGWCSQGVLLWNAIPTCEAGKSLSHNQWVEWSYLTRELISSLARKGIVFVFLGGIARTFAAPIRDKTSITKELKRGPKGYVSKGIIIEDLEHTLDNTIIELSHPSPRVNSKLKNPFFGSRVFSTINASLVSKGYSSIDWNLST